MIKAGIATCRALKDQPATRAIPVVFLTGRDDEPGIIEAFQAAAADSVVKPFEPRILLARVRTHLALAALSRGLERRLGERTQARWGIPMTYTLTGPPPALGRERSVIQFQSARELVYNLIKRAQARRGAIGLATDAAGLRLSVEDDGVGFAHIKLIRKMQGDDRIVVADPIDYTRWRGDQWQDATVAGWFSEHRFATSRSDSAAVRVMIRPP